MRPNPQTTNFLLKKLHRIFLSNKKYSHKIAFPNPFQPKDAQGGASNFQKRILDLDFYEALFLYRKKTPRIFVINGP